MHLQYAAVVDDLFDILGSPEGEDEVVTVALRVHVQPGAGRTAVVGRHGDALKVRVAAPPVDGRANDACRALLAETFGVAESAVELTAGPSSRMKRFTLAGVELDEFRRRLRDVVDTGNAAGGPRVRRR
jgi:uncharacterized protein (TIGR00251 family)